MKCYRYTYNEGDFGGIIFANNKREARKKLKESYIEVSDKYKLKNFEVWDITSDFYWNDNGVCEIYGV